MIKRIKCTWCTFEKSSIDGIFNKTYASRQFQFDFIKFSRPKSDYLLNKGVIHVIQSWDTINRKRIKTLHTGLIEIGIGRFFYGDNLNEKGGKDFILMDVVNPTKVILYVVKDRNPRSKIKFSHELINQIL